MRLEAIFFLLLAATSAPAIAEQPGAALDPEVKAALDKARYDLKDPDSARFRNLFKYVNSRGFTVVCGEMNAKNSYGAYSGFQRFAATNRGASIVRPDDIAGNVLMDTTCIHDVNESKRDITLVGESP